MGPSGVLCKVTKYLRDWQTISCPLNEYPYLGSLILDRQGLYSKSATKVLIKQLNEIKPNIIHLHNIHGHYLNYHILFEYIKTNNIPVVWTLHDCWSFTGHCVHFENVKCEKWIEGCYKCPNLKSYPTSIFDRSKQNWEDKKEIFSTYPNIIFVPVSHWIEKFLNKSFFRNHKSLVIHNGIDLGVFHPKNEASIIVSKQYNIDPYKHIILGVASQWNEHKGFKDFLQVSQLLGHNRFSFIIVGVNGSQLKNLPPNVIGITRTNNQSEIATLYSAASVYINPTYSDTYPTTNLESIACGTPVITYDTGGSPESITPQTGRVITCGNINELKQNIIELCDSEQPQSISQACRNYAETHFDREQCFYKYIELYNDIICNQ